MIVGDLEIRLRADIARLQADMTQARRTVTETQDRINSAANAMKMALAGIGIGAGLAEIIKMADEYAKFTAQLRLASTSVADYAASYEAVKRIAKTSQQDMASTGVLYARIANGTRELGTTQKQVAAITETVNLALRVSGATATESASAQLQLSQAFASGTLRGEEFNAVNEAAPRLMKALADGMGLPVGALKAMAGEGQITSNIMATVLPKALESLREESKNIQTISGAFTVLKNEMLEFFGMQAQANGTVAIITASIGYLAEHLDALVTVLKTAMAYQIGTWMANWTKTTYTQVTASMALRAATIAQAEADVIRTATEVAQAEAAIAGLAVTHESTLVSLRAANATRASAQAAIAAATAAGAQSYALMVLRTSTAELAVAETLRAAYLVESAALDKAKVAALAQLAAATAAQTLAQNSLNAATAGGITAAGMASKAIAFLGGPIGAIILIIGALTLAWQLFGKKAKEANAEAVESLEEATIRINKLLDKQIEKHEAILALRDKGVKKEEAEKHADVYAQLAALERRRAAYEQGTRGTSASVALDLMREIDKEIAVVQAKIAKARETGAAAEKLMGQEAYNEWKKTYATREEQRAAEIADLKSRNLNAEQYADILGRINLKYADKGAAAGLKKEEQAYVTLIASIREKIEAGRLENATDVDATESQKLRIKLESEIKAGKLKLADAHLIAARAALDELDAVEKIAKARATEKDVSARIQESTLARQDSAAALAVEYLMMGKSSDARELAMVAVREQTALERFLLQEKLAGKAVTEDQIKRLTEEAAARVRVEQATLAQTKALGYAAQLADENRRFVAESQFDEKSRAAALLKIDAAMWQERIALAGAGTEAQKRLQEEYSTWYSNQLAKPEIEGNRKMWESIDTTAHDTFVSIFDSGKSTFDRLRDTLKNGLLDLLYQMTIKKWILNIGAAVSGGGAAGLASADGLGLTGGAAGGGLGGIASLAQSAKTAYTIATQGFSGVAAGIGGSIATLGNLFGSSAVSAFGAGMGMTGAQAAAASAAYGSAGMAGTGTALTSGALAGAAVTAAAGIAAGVLGGKLISGQYGSNSTVNVGTGIGAVAGAFMGGPIGAAIGGALGGVIGGIGNRVFGMGEKKYGETGITGALSGTGFSGTEYAKWTQKGGWLRSDKKDTDRKAVDATTSNAFVETYAAIRNVSATLANTLGIDTSSLATRAQALNINLTGLTTEADRLGAVTKFFEGVGNAIAVELLPNVGQFKQGNEELSVTLQRVAGNYAGVDAALQLIGRTSQDAFGAVGVATIGARENLIKLAGSLDSLTSGTSFFAENFLTEAEQMAPVLSTVADTLGKLGMSGVKSVEQYKEVVLGLDLASTGGQEMYIKLLALAPAFKAAADYGNQLAAATGNYAAVVKTASEIASERMDLQKQLNELTKSETELLAIQRSSIAAVNRALFDQVQAAKAVVTAKDVLAKAYDREAAAAQTALDKSKSWVATLNGLNASMALGSQSTLTPEQKYAEARAQFEKTLAAANAGDTTAQSGLSAAEQAFLTASQVVNASDARYAADYARVVAANNEALKWASAQVDVQQASLDALKAQVSGLITINDSVLTVAQAIVNLRAAMGTAAGLGVEFTSAPAVDAPVAFSNAPAPVVFDAMRYSAGSNVGSDALVAEIRALNARLDAQTVEIKGLRADQAKQTGATIQATVESNAKAAKTVVAGVDKSAKASAWAKQVEYSA
ncbi:tape measure protein [Janthinobacterium sp. PLB04]|uniref:Tape measure protein n=1 Tax=Janthinobacterium lividum TaxID=29581 RepID=A0AAJ4MVG5_9BURK|nr:MULTISPECIES: tape measure protein [Janthinobacterium]KAB0331778.1 tape measure protein [Janthinobacterium lividum]QSX97979.1 tape measure protein [Janthinobacterium lividum]UGQ37949.1 tape measure protein [Janthinobacterium sp. PLB04]